MGARDDLMQKFGPLRQEAEALVILDELNIIRNWITSFKAAVAAATSLADLQSRVAALDNMPERNQSQIIPAIESKLTELEEYNWPSTP